MTGYFIRSYVCIYKFTSGYLFPVSILITWIKNMLTGRNRIVWILFILVVAICVSECTITNYIRTVEPVNVDT